MSSINPSGDRWEKSGWLLIKNSRLISCLVLRVSFRTAPIYYSGEHLPLFATGGNPEGSHATCRIAFCSWTCSRVRGQQWVSGHRGRTASTGETLCWHCVWILWTMLSQTRRGWWPNQSPCYWSSTGDYSSRPFDIGQRQMFFFLIFHLNFCFGIVVY